MRKKCTDYVCSKANMMKYLVRKGFDFSRIRQDELQPDNPDRVVYIFPDSPALRRAVAEYYNDGNE